VTYFKILDVLLILYTGCYSPYLRAVSFVHPIRHEKSNSKSLNEIAGIMAEIRTGDPAPPNYYYYYQCMTVIGLDWLL
jgi:hypothetical protein